MLATRFIIALCPATPIYLVKHEIPGDRIFSRVPATVATETTRVKTEALAFETFDEAMTIAGDITGWGGAQRVEQVAVEVPDTRQTLATEDEIHEVCAAATCAWLECKDCTPSDAHSHTEDILRSMGLKYGCEVREGASCFLTIHLADHLGNTLTLDWNPMVDGFDITEATCLSEDDDGIACDGCGSDDAEPCGDPEGFAFCAACRAKDSDAAFNPHDVDADAEEVEDLPLYADTASPSVFVSPEEVAAAVRRTDCATVTLTDAQRERAAVLLAAALRDLIDFHLPRLTGNAQLDAAEGA